MKTILCFASVGALLLCSCAPKNRTIAVTYPETASVAQEDDYFGTKVADPYRWLEDDRSEEAAAWVEAQNKVTDAYLSHIPFREKIKARMTDLTNYEKFGSPFKKNGKYYFYKNDGLQNQSVLYVQNTLDDEPTVFLDPNKLSDDGTVALSDVSFSNNGNYVAYAISRSGSDWREIFVIDLATGALTNDHVQWAKFSSAAWHGDGFYYSAYDAPEKGKEFSNVNENHKIYYHKIGTPQSADQLVFEDKKHPKRFYYAVTDEDEQALFIFEDGEGNGNNLFIVNISNVKSAKNVPVLRLTNSFDYRYSPIEIVDGKLLIFTNEGANRNKIMVTALDKPQRANWVDLVPETDAVLSDASVIGDKLMLKYDKDASTHIYRADLQGQILSEIALPTLGSASISGNKHSEEAFYVFTSFTFPPTIYRYNTATDESVLFRKANVKFNPEDYTTEQVFYPSKDGTKVPMFLTYKKGLKKNGKNPVLLYAYGGFNISVNPGFSTSRLVLLESGGIYASANLRGGSEYGEEWHLAGTKQRKQNVFDDFIAAAEYLIDQKYTSSEHIAIQGGSNGGLLVGAVLNQRPDLFKVAIPQVGVMDMLRYHKFTIGWNWASDFGTSEDSKEMFDYIYQYSPLHTIKSIAYPAVLVTTADHDDRVVPAHSFKYIATLQANNTGQNPTLIRIATKAGHGSGKPLTKVIEEQSDIYSFIFWNLGLTY
ncbi:prolyl endopeptidase [Bacteroidia bacterium]|nr:prolyl endopeptidase [Bacteroidia bacterium]